MNKDKEFERHTKMDLEMIITDYLEASNQLQIATTVSDQPWCCTVYFAHDEKYNMYWISKKDSRHSQEIEQNKKTAGVIVKEHALGDPVRGLSLEGESGHIPKDSPDFLTQFSHYATKFNWDQSAINEMADGTNYRDLYVFKPTSIVLFDALNFPGEKRQVLSIN